jgi:hypothetical protein
MRDKAIFADRHRKRFGEPWALELRVEVGLSLAALSGSWKPASGESVWRSFSGEARVRGAI